MDRYVVTGMSCAACQARVEKAVSGVPGVESCSVNLLTNSMGVTGTASPAEIIRAVEKAGYGAAELNSASPDSAGYAGSGQGAGRQSSLAAQEDALADRDTPVLKRRLFVSLGFLAVLLWFSMGHMLWGLPLPAFFHNNHVAMGLIQLLLSGIICVINRRFFESGFRSLLHGAPNMDTLIALGSAAAMGYSTVMLFAMTRAQADGGTDAAAPFMNEFYFESAAMILTLITLGKLLEARAKGRTTDALRSLLKLAPKKATILRDGAEITVPVDEVAVGDLFVVRPGETIPIDGEVESGESAVNEAAITGESIPVDKVPGDRVTSATLNHSGFLTCRALRVGEDTSIAQIIRMVSDAAATKAPVARLADRISGIFVPAVIGIAVLTLVIWLFAGADPGFALARAICVLVVSCPCALGLATPVAIMVGNGVGARNGILFKTAEALQQLGGVQIIALDKTGTVTKGEPAVCGVFPMPGVDRDEFLTLAASLEQASEHPLAKAIVKEAEHKNIILREVQDFQALSGQGAEGRIGGREVVGGNERLIAGRIRGPIPEENGTKTAGQLAGAGRTPTYFACDGQYLGMIAVADYVRDDSADALEEFRRLGIASVLLTGDNPGTAAEIGRQVRVDRVYAGILPGGKAEIIRQLKRHGRVAMVGDGINDAPALAEADVGIAIGAGTDVAIDAADVVLVKNSLRDVAAGIRLSRSTYRNIMENLFWALFYNVLLIPAAAGVYSRLFGITMNPMLGAAAMSLSSFCVVMNALRLNLADIRNGKRDRAGKRAISGLPETTDGFAVSVDDGGTRKKGDAAMTKTMKIEGMMCAHCEATVKKALEAVEGVVSAEVSHEAGQAVVTLSGSVDDAALKKAVEDKDYRVLEVA
ncbi:MAG: heavy metal translocating P-type ATPase [Lachnospiraceae bacterium]|nr:heavy metal translocating P-type ATPase [Lachnospiraceae bacterium]